MKKIRLIALLLISMVVFSAKSSIAQDSTFKLSDYKNPNYFYQTLDLNFGLNNSNYGAKSTGASIESYNAFSLNSQAAAVYRRNINSATAQDNIRISIYAGIGTNSSNSDGTYDVDNYENKNKQFSHNEALIIAVLHRFYNQKQNFIEINGSANTSNMGNSGQYKTNYSNISNSSEESSKKGFNGSLAGSFLIGKGRIEQVQDAQLAMYILNDLYKLNRQNSTVTYEDVYNLAQLITSLKYKRFFDNRLQHIAEITSIDSLLQKKNISGTADATYFTSLNDNWNYANNPIRENGYRLFTGLEASFGYTFHDDYLKKIIPDNFIDETKTKTKNLAVLFVLGYIYEKPTSFKWQNSANIKGSVGFRQYYNNAIFRNDPNPDTKSDHYNESAPSIFIHGDYGFGYYPNSRTWLTFDWFLNTGWAKNMQGNSKAEKEDSYNDFYGSTGPNLNAYYYLSEKLRLNFSYYGSFSLENDKYTFDAQEGSADKSNRKNWRQDLNVSLTYSLF